MKTNKFKLLSLLVLFAFLAASLPTANVLAQDEDLKGCVPKVVSPIGTILDTTPTYQWGLVTNATSYNYQVWKGTTSLHDETLDSAACTATGCEATPALTLGRAVYKWRVRAYVDGVWKNFSKFTFFTVSPPGFNHSFNSTMGTWAWKGGGTWSIASAKYLYTAGLVEDWTSAYSTRGQYTDFDYSVRTRRIGDGTVFIAARMGNLVKGETSEWYPGYRFGYCDGGEYAVFRINADGTRTVIQDWTVSSVIKSQYWNTLRVVAEGSQFSFYVNDNLMLTFTDTAFERGFVGVTGRRETVEPYQLYVDWARLTVIESD